MNRLWRRFLPRPVKRVRLKGLPAFAMKTHGWRDIYVSTAIMDWGIWDRSGTFVVRELLKSDACFIDIGANIGWFTVVAALSLAGRGEVHCFEPEPANFDLLAWNVKRNRLADITANRCALADRSGTVTLYLSNDNLGDHALARSGRPDQTIEVEAMRFDDYDGISQELPLVIKLDVQGSEVGVLRGATSVISGHRHDVVILCELSPANLSASGGSLDELITTLRDLGFAPALVDRATPRITPTSWQRVRDAISEGLQTDDHYERDVVAYRRPDGLMAPLFSKA